MKKIEFLLKKAESFEKLSAYGDKRQFLISLSQAEYVPNDKSSHETMVDNLKKSFDESRAVSPGTPLTGDDIEISNALTRLQSTLPSETNKIKDLLGFISTNANSPLAGLAKQYLNVLNYAAPSVAPSVKKPVVLPPHPKAAAAKKEIAFANKLVNDIRQSSNKMSFFDTFNKTVSSLNKTKIDLTADMFEINSELVDAGLTKPELPPQKEAEMKRHFSELETAVGQIEKTLLALNAANPKMPLREKF